MKKTKILVATVFAAIIGLITVAADHIDAPAVAGGSSDITDYYAFQGQDTNNIVFVASVQGLLSPSATAGASFDENVMVEFNIDTDGDAVEDLVIQAIPKNGKMYFYGPYMPDQVGSTSSVNTGIFTKGEVSISKYGESAVFAESAGMKFFAGPRDDPFFMDFARYGEIIAGNATSFNNPGADTFAGSNVMSIVVEVPKSLLGGGASINTWVEAKIKQ